MPRWTKEELDAYCRKRQATKPEPTARHEQVAALPAKKSHPGRILIRIESRRTILLDPDNLVPKYHIDCLRYAGLIHDDTPEQVTILPIKQTKVATRKEEETIIDLTYV